MNQESVEHEESLLAQACPDSVEVPAPGHPEQPWIIPREYEIGGVRWFSDAVRELERALHPLLAQIPRVELADMPRAPAEGEPLPAEASPLYRPMVTKHEWTVHVEDVVNFDVEQFLADLVDMAQDVGSQMVKMVIEHISEVSEKVGNVVSAEGRDFFDVYAESLETIEMTFDENGDHNLTMLANPETYDRVKDKTPTPEQEARINAIIDRKREEWRAARRRRELP
jgi:hypothetical protein